MSKAIVTFAVGKATTDMFNDYVHESWKRYAFRHGYELIVLDQPVRPDALTEERPIVFQRLVLFEHPEVGRFDDVVYVDADIIINYRDAPCIVSQHGGGGIGMTATDFDRGYVDPVEHTAFAGRMAQAGQAEPGENSEKALKQLVLQNLQTIDPAWQRAVFMNAGVLVLNQQRHADFLVDVFDRYNDDVIYPGAEQTILTYELLRSGNHTQLQDAYNRYWVQVRAGHYPFLLTGDASPDLRRQCVTAALCNSYFLHFAGPADVKDDMPLVDLQALETPRGVFNI
ncbi:MAG: hypothetical protein AAF563_06745 [Pseudomonadota bacterium]